jgi:hypothetical protein
MYQITQKQRTKSHSRVVERLEKIREPAASGKRKLVRHLIHQHMNSFDTKLIAVDEANKKMKRHRRVKAEQIIGIAERLDPWRGTKEPVLAHMKGKKDSSGNYRWVMNFGIENRALQQMTRDILRFAGRIAPGQYGCSGGVKAAGKAVLKNLDDGYVYVAEVDIKNCYPSFNREGITTVLPVPKEIVNKVLTSHCLNIVLGNPKDIYQFSTVGSKEEADDIREFSEPLLAEARQGIPQGSAVSPVVAELVLAPIVVDLPEFGRVVNYADNFLVMAKSEPDAVSMLKALRSAFKANPVGPLTLKVDPVTEAGAGFDFLGYEFRKSGNYAHCQPSQKNHARFKNKWDRLHRCVPASESENECNAHLAQLRKHTLSWANSFPLWEEAEAFKLARIAAVDELAISCPAATDSSMNIPTNQK